jgi:hypothetical protein
VSVIAAELVAAVEAFRTRRLDGRPYTFVPADAPVLKVCEDGRVVGMHKLIATDVNAEGYRELLGVDRVLDALSNRLPKVAEHLDPARRAARVCRHGADARSSGVGGAPVRRHSSGPGAARREAKPCKGRRASVSENTHSTSTA